MKRFLLFLLACAAPAAALDYMPLDQVKPGMKGFGLSVFRGTTIERFNVEVLSVIRNFAAKQDVILVRCSGQNLEHSGIVAGMSGSPVYLEGKMIGAIAYGWAFSKDPIGGVQPIEQMINIAGARGEPKAKPDDKKPADKKSGRLPPVPGVIESVEAAVDTALDRPLAIAGRKYEYARLHAGSSDKPEDDVLVLQRLETPLMVGGSTPSVLRELRDELRSMGLVPMAGGQPAGADALASKVKIEEGSVVAVQLMTGDMDMSATGTVTARIEDRFLAFGHSMFAEGISELPIATGYVHSVIPTVNRSFKLSGTLETVGRLTRDEETGILGTLSSTPPAMAPVTVKVDIAGRKEVYRYKVAHHNRFTPVLVRMAVLNSLTSRHDFPAQHTLKFAVSAKLSGFETPLKLGNTLSGTGPNPAALAIAVPIAVLMDSPFGKSRLESLDIELTVEDRATLAPMVKARLDRDRVRPGDTVTLFLTVNPYRMGNRTIEIPFTVPAETPEGRYELSVNDAINHIRRERAEAPHRFVVTDYAELFELASYDEPNTSVFLRLRLPTGGLVVDGHELPELPGSRLAMIIDSRRTNVIPFSAPLVIRKDTPYVIAGRARFLIAVDKRADQ